MRQLYHMGCSPKTSADKPLTKEEAILYVLDSVEEKFSAKDLVVTFVRQEGPIYNFMVSMALPKVGEVHARSSETSL
jgi:hypothetical protein